MPRPTAPRPSKRRAPTAAVSAAAAAADRSPGHDAATFALRPRDAVAAAAGESPAPKRDGRPPITVQTLPDDQLRLIDLATDELYPVSAMARRLCGRNVSGPTLWRWIVDGTAAGKLEAKWVGGRWCTSTAAMADFVERQTAARIRANAERTARRRREATDATDDELRDAGLLDGQPQHP